MDHINSINTTLAKQAKVEIYLRDLNKREDKSPFNTVEAEVIMNRHKLLQPEYDLQGNVVRNHQRELLAFEEFEQKILLPSVTEDYFESYRRFHNRTETSTQVKRVGLAFFPKNSSNKTNIIAKRISMIW